MTYRRNVIISTAMMFVAAFLYHFIDYQQFPNGMALITLRALTVTLFGVGLALGTEAEFKRRFDDRGNPINDLLKIPKKEENS